MVLSRVLGFDVVVENVDLQTDRRVGVFLHFQIVSFVVVGHQISFVLAAEVEHALRIFSFGVVSLRILGLLQLLVRVVLFHVAVGAVVLDQILV